MASVNLKDQTPLFEGVEKYVYEHPNDDSLLIKIPKKTAIPVNQNRHPIGFKFVRLRNYWSFVHQVIEYFAVYEFESEHPEYIEQISGFVKTDLGLGMVVNKIFHDEAQIAKNLRQIVKDKEFSALHRERLDSLLQWMTEANVVIRDFSLNNMVWDGVNQHFVIIDGIGGKPSWSLRSYSKAYNRRSNTRRVAKLRERLAKAMGSDS